MPSMVLLFALLAATGSAQVSVAYAGSLVHAMEGPFAQGLARDTGLQFAGEGKGSKALAHLIDAGLRQPDVFISADTSLLESMLRENPPKVRGYYIFGSARMVLAYSPRSRYAALFARAARNHEPLLRLLSDANVRVGRTDPQLDPKGARTVHAVSLLGRAERQPALAQTLLQRATMFPEEDLALRVETGELDVGFFYSTEIPGRGLDVIELPPSANLSTSITYAAAVLTDALHPKAARTFVNYLLNGHGRSILQGAGIRYFAHPKIIGTP